MSQEDNICDIELAERLFEMKMRSFRQELNRYAAQIP